MIGILLAFRQVIRLFPEVAWVNGFRLADPGLAVERAAGAARADGDDPRRRASAAWRSRRRSMRGMLDSIATRLDEARDISRYMTGLLVFLGLLGTFWGLIETVGSVGGVIQNLKVGGDAGAMFDALKEGLAAPLGGMGISFSSSLFGLAGSLVLGFLDLQAEPGAEPLLHRSRGLARDHRAATSAPSGRTPAAVRHAIERLRRAIERLERRDRRNRLEQGGDHRDGQSRRSDPGPRPAHAHRAADDPRLGRRAGRAARARSAGCSKCWSRETRAQA